MREFEITRARKSDAEALAALEAVCFPPEEAATLAGFEARLDAFGDWFFVAKTPDGEIIGMIDGMATDEASIADEMFEDASLHKPNGRVQTVFGLDVLPQWRHRGVAGALMDAFVEAAKQAGREKVTLTCKKRPSKAAFFATAKTITHAVTTSWRRLHLGAHPVGELS